MTETKNKKSHSSYWMGDFWGDSNRPFLGKNDTKNHDLIKLAKTKRAIANFVKISTRQNIPVIFNNLGESYTDGKSVVLSTTFETPRDFDVASGLALHESMHIKHSDFEIVKNLGDRTPRHSVALAIKKGIPNWLPIIKNCLNYVEDRWIDYKNYEAAPGYRSYYTAMYDKYFNSPIVDKGLQSPAHRTETIDSYMFRFINLHNKNTDLKALKGLNGIMKAMDFKNMDRFDSTEDTFKVACEIFHIILESVDVDDQQKENEKNEGKGDEKGENGNGGENDPETLTDEEFDKFLDDFKEESGEGDEGDDDKGEGDDDKGEVGEGSSVKKIKLTPEQTKKLEDVINEKVDKQRKFMDGEVQKDGLNDIEQKEVKQIEETGTEIKNVGNDTGLHGNVDVIVVKKLTRKLMESSSFPMTSTYNGKLSNFYSSAVEHGLRIGKMLGKKLLIRSESRTTVFNRQKVGKIDKRMIAGLGYGNESVFEFTDVDEFNNANLHVSIDASGSMSGNKWIKTITNVTALCKAVDMIPSLNIQVTFRTTDKKKPYVVLAYDSRVDTISKVKQLFPSLETNGTTPEGLCFEAIMKDFLRSTTTMDSYFLNISDGEPYFSSPELYYSDGPAVEHTRKMVKKIENMGIKTLSYFISNGSNHNLDDFKKMYGSGAKNINVTNVGEITRTINKMFLNKK